MRSEDSSGPLPDGYGDAAVQREAELMERALLYVAITRARRAALVTAHGTVSGWLTSEKKQD